LGLRPKIRFGKGLRSPHRSPRLTAPGGSRTLSSARPQRHARPADWPENGAGTAIRCMGRSSVTASPVPVTAAVASRSRSAQRSRTSGKHALLSKAGAATSDFVASARRSRLCRADKSHGRSWALASCSVTSATEWRRSPALGLAVDARLVPVSKSSAIRAATHSDRPATYTPRTNRTPSTGGAVVVAAGMRVPPIPVIRGRSRRRQELCSRCDGGSSRPRERDWTR